MIINLIKPKQMFSLTLPDKIKGRYWITDTDDFGRPRELISVEAVNGEWVAKSNKYVSILNADNEPIKNTILRSQAFMNLRIAGSDDKAMLYVENSDDTRHTFRKIVARKSGFFEIGRSESSDIVFSNRYVSSRHAKLSFDGRAWSIQDLGSTNGTFVNGYRAESRLLDPGDMIFIMGLKILVGQNFLAINDPDHALEIKSQNFVKYVPQQKAARDEIAETQKKDYFFRSPRFHREVEHAEIVIDPPPQLQKLDTVPLALMLGPSITMGMASVSTAIITLNNTILNGGSLTQAMPTLVMAVSMLLGTVLWPILTKNNEKKMKIQMEQKRQEKYLAYLESVRDNIKRKCKEQSEILEENFISPEECASRIVEQKTSLWERTIGQSDFLSLRVGKGNIPMDADIKYAEKKFSMENDNLQDAMMSLGAEQKELTGVPMSVSFVDYTTVGICGSFSETVNLTKSLILQMIALHSYDELKIMLIADKSDEKEWNFVKFIPHFWSDDKSMRFLATDVDEVKELSSYIDKHIVSRGDASNGDYTVFSTYYVIIATNKELAESCEALQQLLHFKSNSAFSTLFVTESMSSLPKETKMVISLDRNRSKMFDRDDTSGKIHVFSPDVVSEALFDSISEDIANIELDLNSKRYDLPSMLSFLEMFNVSKIEHLNCLTRWKENNPTISLQAPVGVDQYGGVFNLDLHERFHGPHGLVAGMTGSGKSEFIITYILSLAVNYHPDEVAFVLIDYKGGGLTGAFEDSDRGVRLPHLAGTITNLDGAAINRSLISIQSELRRRQAIFNEARKVSNEGTMDIYKYQQLYRDRIVTEPVPHLFIISDEFAELKTQQPEFMEQLISAARIGRSLGVHLILATQKPSGVVDDQIWSNSKFRVCLKVQDKADSQEMIKRPDAAELVQTGRFYLQVGFNEFFALGQSAWCGAEYIPTETIEKAVDTSVQIVDNLGHVIMSAKPPKKKTVNGSKVKQIVAIVKYLSDLAEEENIKVRPLWLTPIPEFIFVDELEKKYGVRSSGFVLDPVVGEYDDPFNQKQQVLTIPFAEAGNCIVYGATGSGKSEFLTALTYSLIKNHTPDEVNIYIMDFGAETLKMFDDAPQVGGVLFSSDEEKTVNLIKMLSQEIEIRKALFSEYGGDFGSYCRNSGKTVPNIVVMVNNFAGFSEAYEELQDAFGVISRDGPKYGIYFVITASTVNGVRYRTQQNFRFIMTMQLNDQTDYLVAIGKTDGLIPSKYKGRGLVKLDRPFEFQTAYCCENPDVQEFIRKFSAELALNYNKKAKRIPVLPTTVNLDYVREYITDIKAIPVAVAKKSLDIIRINLGGKVIYPVAVQDMSMAVPFAEELVKVMAASGKTTLVDAERMITDVDRTSCEVIDGDYELFVQSIFSEMVTRNNTFKDSGLEQSSLDGFEERSYVIFGFKRFFDSLSLDGKDKLKLLLEKGESFYKLHFVIMDPGSAYSSYSYDAWYKRHFVGDGIWIGDGVTDQMVFKLSKLSSVLYEEIGDEYGYLFIKNRLTLIKLLSSLEE